ncbi:D-alanyl-D-alanine carboxypeptidase family protein [Roseibium sp.]|uniref:D-alanyl-D-alanine carboxypeptidase family protein n=1 Tax=Roseibium sp. TaxID=1936156 RepID=UPI003A9875E7
MPLTVQDIFELQMALATAAAKLTNPAEKAELQAQIEFYQLEKARLTLLNAEERIALLAARISRVEEIIGELADGASLLIPVAEFREKAGVPRQTFPAAPASPAAPVSPVQPTPPAPSVQPSPGSPPTPGQPAPPATPSPPVAAAPPVNPEKRDTDLAHLHPLVRQKVEKIQKELDKANIPMRVFEAYRSPERQAFLYAKGRTSSGPKVTNAGPWQSYHQYGMAADFVRFENGRWNWNDSTPQQQKEWDRFHDIARAAGLEPLTWERPHVQLIGTSFANLLNGDFPEEGDDSWASNLSDAILRWPGSKKPPLPQAAPRPPMPAIPASTSHKVSAGDWGTPFDGDAWRYDASGVYTMEPNGTQKLWRTAGAPTTIQEILSHYAGPAMAASERHEVPPALILMTIATETAAFRLQKFTGPKTFRWEAHCKVNATGDPAIDGKEKGDYSAGPMQVLADTARWINTVRDLGHDTATAFKFFKNKPAKAPASLGLYDPVVCIDVGTAYIRHNMGVTGDNPLLVAAVYNAGSLRPSAANRWRIHCHGNHIDRAAEWYGDACAVLNGV